MTDDQQQDAANLTCGKCDKPVTAWPYMVIPEPDGTPVTYHMECSPLAGRLESQ